MAKFLCLFLIFCSFVIVTKIVSANSQVVINELLPTPSSGNDWIELFNSSEEDINISGWILDDEGTSTNMLQVPQDTILPKKSYKLFYVSNRLNKSGDTVYLKNGEIEVDRFEYSTTETDVSYGRYPDGGSDWGECTPTAESTNSNCEFPPEPSPQSADDEESNQSSSSNTQSSKSSPKASPMAAKSSPSTSKSTAKTLGEKNISISKLLPTSTPSASPETQENSGSSTKIAGFLTGAGAIFIGASLLFYFWYYKIKNKAKDPIEKKG